MTGEERAVKSAELVEVMVDVSYGGRQLHRSHAQAIAEHLVVMFEDDFDAARHLARVDVNGLEAELIDAEAELAAARVLLAELGGHLDGLAGRVRAFLGGEERA